MKNLPKNRLRILPFVALVLWASPLFLSPLEAGAADWKFLEKDDEGLWIYDAETVEYFPSHRVKVQTRKIYERKAVLAAATKLNRCINFS